MRLFLLKNTNGVVLGLSLTFLCLTNAWAQNGTIQGKVTDENGEPAAGASVIIIGTTRGTSVASDGSYSLNVSIGNIKIQFTGIGYKTITKEVSISAGQTMTIDVQLESGSTELENIVVSASRQPIRKIETSLSIDILDSKELSKQVAPTIGDALRFTPGVYVVSQRGRVRTNIIMRGFPENLGTEDKYTAMLIDGLPAFAGSGNAYDQFYTPDLNTERVEVVRGAAATLFGRNAAAGVYNVIFKTGGDQLHGAVEQTFAQAPFDSKAWMYRTDINLNGPITKDLKFNLGGFYMEDPGYRSQPGLDKGFQFRANLDYQAKFGNIRLYGGVRNLDLFNNIDIPYAIDGKSIIPGFDTRYTHWTPLFYGISYTRPTGVTATNIPGVPGDPNNVESGNVGVDNQRGNFSEGFNIGLRFNFDLGGGFSVQNHARYQTMDLGTKFLAAFNYINFASVPIFNSTGRRDLKDFINELIFKKTAKIGNSDHVFTLGGYLGTYTQNTRASGFFGALNLSDPANVTLATTFPGGFGIAAGVPMPVPGLFSTNVLRNTDLDATVTNTSIFFGDEMAFLDNKLKITLGLRYDWADLNLLNYLPKSANGLANGPQFPSLFTDERDFNIGSWSATLGINYLINENTAVYGNFVRSFRAPDEATFSPLARVPLESVINYANANASSPFAVNIDKPEIVTNGEVGFRTSFLKGDLTLDVAAFYTSITNRLISGFREVAPGDIRAISVSEGSIGIGGGELALVFSPSAVKGLTLRTNVTYQLSKFTKFPNFIYENVGRTTFDVTGNRVENIPSLIWNWSASYEREIASGFSAGLGLDGSLMADRYADEFNLIRLPNAYLMNGNLFVRKAFANKNAVTFSVRTSNLTDTDTILWWLDFAPIGNLINQNNLALQGVPFLPRRTFFSINYTF